MKQRGKKYILVEESIYARLKSNNERQLPTTPNAATLANLKHLRNETVANLNDEAKTAPEINRENDLLRTRIRAITESNQRRHSSSHSPRNDSSPDRTLTKVLSTLQRLADAADHNPSLSSRADRSESSRGSLADGRNTAQQTSHVDRSAHYSRLSRTASNNRSPISLRSKAPAKRKTPYSSQTKPVPPRWNKP